MSLKRYETLLRAEEFEVNPPSSEVATGHFENKQTSQHFRPITALHRSATPA